MSTHINVCFSEIFILRIIKTTMYWQLVKTYRWKTERKLDHFKLKLIWFLVWCKQHCILFYKQKRLCVRLSWIDYVKKKSYMHIFYSYSLSIFLS